MRLVMRMVMGVGALVLTVLSTATAQPAPQGHLVIIGGGARPASVMQTFVRLAGGATGKVLVFPQASSLPDAGATTKAEFEKLGVGRVELMAVDRAGADADETLARAEGATGIYFGGGDQNRLTAALRGSRLERLLKDRYAAGAVVGGTSAGAAVMSALMITGDERRPLSKDDAWQILEADNVVTDAGFGFIDGVIVDQHFVRRKRHNRLISLVLEHPSLVGIAIDESTAVWVKPGGTEFEVIGEGPVLVFDASAAKVTREPAGYGLRGADLRLHVLRPGAQYDLRARRVTRLSE
jgi:cyanophycinase